MLVRRPIVGIRPLVTVWNMTWFCVNLMGFLRLLPLVVHNLTRYSLSQNVCVHADSLWTSGTTGVWARLWVHFKLWEVLVESVLVVLLKQPCGILQWFNNYAYVLLHGKHLLASRVPGGGIVILTYYGIVAFMNLYCCYMNLHQIPQPKKSTALLDSIYLLQTLSGVVLAITTLHYWKQAMWNHKHCHANEEHIRIMAFAWTGGHVLIGALALIDKQWAATNQAAIEAEAAHRRRRRRKQLQDAKKNNLPAPKTVTFAGAEAEAEHENNKQDATKKKTKQQLVKENGSNHDNHNNTQPNGNNKENVENGNHSDKENAAVNNGHNQKDDKINGLKNGTKKDDNKTFANGTNGAKTPKPSPAEIQRRIASASPPSSPSRNRVVRASSPSRNGVHVASSPSSMASHNVSSSMTMIHPHLAAMKGEKLPPSSLIPVPEDGTAEDFVRTVLLDVSEKASMDSSSSLLGGNLNDIIFAQEQEPVIMQGGKRKRKKKKKNKKKRQNGANTVAAANNHEQQPPVISHQRRRDDNSSSNDSTSAGSGESGTTGSSFGSGSAGSSFESSNTASSASSTSSTDAVVDADGWALSGTDKKKQRKLEKKLKRIEARLIRQLLNEQQQQEEEENEEYEERKRDKNEERKEKMD
eukprot:Sro136_g063950.1 fatty acid elongase (639) ;mRNA; r:9966-11882